MTDIEAIEWLEHIRDRYIHGGDAWFDEKRCRAIEYAIKCIYKSSKWIPVTERLPEKGETVIALGSRGGVYAAQYKGSIYWHKLNARKHMCEPTHWMPLPEAPKE